LNGELKKVPGQPDVKERLTGLGADTVAGSSPGFGTFIREEIAKWGKRVKETGIKAE